MIWHTQPDYTLHRGDCVEEMKTMPDNSKDSVVTDPPYGIRFMGKAWDGKDIEAEHKKRAALALNETRKSRKRKTNGYSAALQAGKYDLRSQASKAFQAWTETWAREAYRILGTNKVSWHATLPPDGWRRLQFSPWEAKEAAANPEQVSSREKSTSAEQPPPRPPKANVFFDPPTKPAKRAKKKADAAQLDLL